VRSKQVIYWPNFEIKKKDTENREFLEEQSGKKKRHDLEESI